MDLGNGNPDDVTFFNNDICLINVDLHVYLVRPIACCKRSKDVRNVKKGSQRINAYSMAFIKIVGLVYARRWKKEEQKSYGKMTVVYKANIKQHSNNLQNCTYKLETFTRFIAFQKKKKEK